MTEKDKSISSLKSSIEGSFSPERVESADGKKLLDVLEKLESNIFDETGTVKDSDDKTKYLIKRFTGLVSELLVFSKNLGDESDMAWEEMVAASALGETPSVTLESLGFNSNSNIENVRNVILDFESTAHTIIFNLIRQGFLSTDDLEDLGFSENDLKKIGEMIDAKQKLELQDWIDGKEQKDNKHIEQRYPYLGELKALLDQKIPDYDKYKPKILVDLKEILRKSLEETKDVVGFKKTYLESTYFSKAEKMINDLQPLQEKHEYDQNAEKLLQNYKNLFKDITADLEKIPNGSQKISEIKAEFGAESYKNLIDLLNQLDRKIKGEYSRLYKDETFKNLPLSAPGSSEINELLQKIERDYRSKISDLSELITKAETPTIIEMSLKEIVDEMIDRGWDPFLWREQKYQPTGRMKDIVREFLERSMSPDPEATPDQELERMVQKVRMQLISWDSEAGYEPGAVSVDISKFEEEGINKRQFVRSEFLAATTYHPIWGKDVREILKDIIFTAGLRENEVLISRNENGQSKEMIIYFDNIRNQTEWDEKIKPSDKILYMHDEDSEDFIYAQLADERGLQIFPKYIDKKFGKGSGNEKNEKAIEFAKLLFKSFDMLTVSLMQLQRKTETRGHNGSLDMVDLVMLYDPLAAYIHRSDRYGFIKEDWVGWWLYYLEDINPDDQSLGRVPGADEITRGIKEKSADFLVSKQKELKISQGAFYDKTELIKGKKNNPLKEMEMLGPFQSLFPNLWEAMLLDEDEVLQLPEGNYIKGPNGEAIEENELPKITSDENSNSDEYDDGGGVIYIPGQGDGEFAEVKLPKQKQKAKTKISSFRLYMVARAGWEEMLEITFNGIPNNTPIEFLLEEEKKGGKGGLISRFIGGGVGRAKMFPGRHLEQALGPLLLHLIRRSFQVYKGKGEVAETRLFREIIEGLESSKAGGLERLRKTIDAVIEELKGDRAHYGVMSSTLKKRSDGQRQPQTMRYMDHYHTHHLKKNPPKHLAGYVPNFDVLDSADRNYLLVYRNSPFGKIPTPLTRKGTMQHVKEEK